MLTFRIKKTTKLLLLSCMRKRLESSACVMDRFLADALATKKGAKDLELLRVSLDGVLNHWSKDELIQTFPIQQSATKIEAGGAEKQGIASYQSKDRNRGWWPAKIWQKRLALAQSIDCYVDVLLLQADESIPPHAHIGVVSGFYVVSGAARIQHYHVAEYSPSGLVGHQSVDTVLTEGQSTTNSDLRDNVHWLQAGSEGALLFRINVIGLKSPLPLEKIDSERLYVDPTQERKVDESYVWFPVVDEEQAASIRMIRQSMLLR